MLQKFKHHMNNLKKIFRWATKLWKHLKCQSYWQMKGVLVLFQTVHFLINISVSWMWTLLQWRRRAFYLDVSLLIDEEVLWFKVSVDQVKGVQIFKGQNYLWSIKACMGFTAERERVQRERAKDKEKTHRYIKPSARIKQMDWTSMHQWFTALEHNVTAKKTNKYYACHSLTLAQISSDFTGSHGLVL